jgi:hypothetical protein
MAPPLASTRKLTRKPPLDGATGPEHMKRNYNIIKIWLTYATRTVVLYIREN